MLLIFNSDFVEIHTRSLKREKHMFICYEVLQFHIFNTLTATDCNKIDFFFFGRHLLSDFQC